MCLTSVAVARTVGCNGSDVKTFTHTGMQAIQIKGAISFLDCGFSGFHLCFSKKNCTPLKLVSSRDTKLDRSIQFRVTPISAIFSVLILVAIALLMAAQKISEQASPDSFLQLHPGTLPGSRMLFLGTPTCEISVGPRRNGSGKISQVLLDPGAMGLAPGSLCSFSSMYGSFCSLSSLYDFSPYAWFILYVLLNLLFLLHVWLLLHLSQARPG